MVKKSRYLKDCMNAIYPRGGRVCDLIICHAGHKLSKVATVKRANQIVCGACKDCPDFDDANEQEGR
jgi:hypothetical protein